MSLSADYERQRAWRAWPTVFAALPPLGGRTVLDVGCGVGDQAAGLAERGACVVGFDLNEDLLGVAYHAYPTRTGEALPQHTIERPADPVGERWGEEAVDAVLPRLAAWASELRGQHGHERSD